MSLKPASLQVLDRLTHSPDFTGVIPAKEVHELAVSEGIDVSSLMTRLLPLARTYSHAPISNYHVGAVARGLSGSLYPGMNVEIAGHSLGFSVHGEQAALSSAYMHGERGVDAIAVTAAPCGHCRQFMNEISPAGDIDILVQGRPPLKLSALLPSAFGPRDLGFQAGAFPVRMTNLISRAKTHDELIGAAVASAEHAYAPYSGSLSGVAIKSKRGRVYQGSYIENAAFNPSLSPLQTALVQAILGGEDYAGICEVVFAEEKGAKISQASVTAAVLSTVAPTVQLRVIEVAKS